MLETEIDTESESIENKDTAIKHSLSDILTEERIARNEYIKNVIFAHQATERFGNRLLDVNSNDIFSHPSFHRWMSIIRESFKCSTPEVLSLEISARKIIEHGFRQAHYFCDNNLKARFVVDDKKKIVVTVVRI